MQKERARANGGVCLTETGHVEPNSNERLAQKVERLMSDFDLEEQSCFLLLITALVSKQMKLANVLTNYQRRVRQPGQCSARGPLEPDLKLLNQLKSCIVDEAERVAWARLFAFSALREDQICFDLATRAACIRASH